MTFRKILTAGLAVTLATVTLAGTAQADDEYGPLGPTITPVTTVYTPWKVARDDGWTPDVGHRTENLVYSRFKPRKAWCGRHDGRFVGSERITLRDGRELRAAGLCHFPY